MVAPKAHPNAIEKLMGRHLRGDIRQAETIIGITGKAQRAHISASIPQTTINQWPDAAWRSSRWDTLSKPDGVFGSKPAGGLFNYKLCKRAL